jgi:hypothetical protein
MDRQAGLLAAQVRPQIVPQKRVHLHLRRAVRVLMMTGMKQSTRMTIMIGTDIKKTEAMQMAWMMRWMSWIGRFKKRIE